MRVARSGCFSKTRQPIEYWNTVTRQSGSQSFKGAPSWQGCRFGDDVNRVVRKLRFAVEGPDLKFETGDGRNDGEQPHFYRGKDEGKLTARKREALGMIGGS